MDIGLVLLEHITGGWREDHLLNAVLESYSSFIPVNPLRSEFMLQYLTLPNLPPVAPYSHAVRAGDCLFVTGQLAEDPATGK
jgi:enamine deaminase RidA (YjgF/YER057c/UK114 family)